MLISCKYKHMCNSELKVFPNMHVATVVGWWDVRVLNIFISLFEWKQENRPQCVQNVQSILNFLDKPTWSSGSDALLDYVFWLNEHWPASQSFSWNFCSILASLAGTLIFSEAQCGSEALAFLYPGEYLLISWDSADSISTHLSSGLAPSLVSPLGKPTTAISRAPETQSTHLLLLPLAVVFGKHIQ